MSKPKKSPYKMPAIAMLTLAIVLIIISAFNSSSFAAILGVTLAFWGIILLYISPVKHVPLTMLNATYDTSNIERLLTYMNITLKGVYLPPKNLPNIDSNIVIDSSLVFIPETSQTIVPLPEEVTKLLTPRKDGLLLIPPGMNLCKLFEHELGGPFEKIDLAHLQTLLPKLLMEDLKIAEKVEIDLEANIVTVKVTKSILYETCEATQKQPRTHTLVGCLLSSAIACALAKASGQPITILQEKQNPETKTTQTDYEILTLLPTTEPTTTSAKTEQENTLFKEA